MTQLELQNDTKNDYTEHSKKEDKTPEKKYQWTKDRIVLAIIFTIIMLVSVALLVIIIVDKNFLFNLVKNYFVDPIETLHIALQILLFLILMVLQSLFAPIPSELVLLTGGIIFGILWGSIIGLVGSMLSAAVTFYLSKRGGRSIVDATSEKVGIIKRTIYIFDEWIKTWGLWAIIVGRAVPVIMFDPISYAAGLANIKDKHYFFATFIGSIPRAIFYAVIGDRLFGEIPTDPEEMEAVVNQFNIYFFIIFGILIFMFILSNVIYYLHQKKKRKALEVVEKENNLEKRNDNESNEMIIKNDLEENNRGKEEFES